MSEVEKKLKELRYVVLTYGPTGLSAVRSTEGKTFAIAHPFSSWYAAQTYMRDVEKLTGLKGLVFEKVTKGPSK